MTCEIVRGIKILNNTTQYCLILHSIAQYCPIFFHIATLGSILDTQLSWESSKFQLARWSHEVVLFLVRTDPTRPGRPDPTTRRVSLKMPLKHVWRLCGVPTLVWTPDQLTTAMNGHLPSLGWSPPTQGWSPTRRKYTTDSKFGT